MDPRSLRARLALTVAITAVYIVAFAPLFSAFDRSATIFSAVPVIAAALLFGAWAGLFAGVLAFPVNAALAIGLTDMAYDDFLGNGASVLGSSVGAAVGYAMGWIRDLRVRIESELAQRREADQAVRSLRRQLLEVEEAQRRNVARELHDEIGQDLMGLKLILETGRNERENRSGSKSDEGVELVDTLMVKVRDLSLMLRPSMLDDSGLLAAVLWQTERFASRSGLKVTLEHDGLEGRLPREVETAAYRVVQEALTNVAGHAKATQAILTIRAIDNRLEVSVEDDGIGFDPDGVVGASVGLPGMRERVELLDGRFEVESAPGKGTRINAELSLDRELEQSR